MRLCLGTRSPQKSCSHFTEALGTTGCLLSARFPEAPHASRRKGGCPQPGGARTRAGGGRRRERLAMRDSEMPGFFFSSSSSSSFPSGAPPSACSAPQRQQLLCTPCPGETLPRHGLPKPWYSPTALSTGANVGFLGDWPLDVFLPPDREPPEGRGGVLFPHHFLISASSTGHP